MDGPLPAFHFPPREVKKHLPLNRKLQYLFGGKEEQRGNDTEEEDGGGGWAAERGGRE